MIGWLRNFEFFVHVVYLLACLCFGSQYTNLTSTVSIEYIAHLELLM